MTATCAAGGSTIAFHDVSVSVPATAGPKLLLSGLSLDLAEQRIAVIGANGSGKSTFLKLLNSLVQPSTGTISVNGVDTIRDVRKVRRQVGFVFTDPLAQLVMPTGIEDVELSLRAGTKDSSQRRRRAMELLTSFGLAQQAEQSIYDLSGGERQLLALATVLAVQPRILVADEPTTLLDLRNRNHIRTVLAALPQQVIVSTHDLELAADFQRVLVIDAGRIVQDGEPSAAIAHYRRLAASSPAAPPAERDHDPGAVGAGRSGSGQ